MAAALPFIAVAATVAGSVMQAKSAIDQGRAAQQAAEFNAAADRQRASAALAQANSDVLLQQQDARRAIGRARAAYGASGVTPEGSPMDVLESSAMNAELDKQNILYKGQLRAIGYTDDATLQTAAGQNAVAQGNSKAASAILTGGAKAYGGLGTGSTSAQAGYALGDYSYSTASMA